MGPAKVAFPSPPTGPLHRVSGWAPLMLALLATLLLAAPFAAAKPAVADPPVAGSIVATDTAANLVSYDAATGERLRLVHDAASDGAVRAVVAGPDGLVYVAARDRILRYDGATGERATDFDAGAFDGTVASLAFAQDDTLYVLVESAAPTQNSRVLRFRVADGALLGVILPSLTAPYQPPGVPQLRQPVQIGVGPDNGLYIIDQIANLLVRFNRLSGEFLGTVVGPDQRIFYGSAFAFGPDGALYLSEGLLGSLTNKPAQIFRVRTGGQLAPFAQVPWPSSPLFGPDGDLYVRSDDRLVQLDGQTGALIRTVLPTMLGPGSNTQLVPQSFAFAGGPAAVAPEVKPAFVTAAQRSRPALAARRGAIVTVTVVAANRGRGSAQGTTITLPLDPARAAILDGQLSRPTAWVSAVRRDTIVIETGRLGPGDVVTATLRLRIADDAPAGAVLGRPPGYRWRDNASGGAGVGNTLPLVVADEPLDAPAWPLVIVPGSVPAGGRLQFHAANLLPGEPLALWYNTPAGRAVAIGRRAADEGGAVRGDLATDGMARGWHSLVVQGIWSGIVAAGAFEVR